MNNKKITYLLNKEVLMTVDATDSTLYLPAVGTDVIIPIFPLDSLSYKVINHESVFTASSLNINILLEEI